MEKKYRDTYPVLACCYLQKSCKVEKMHVKMRVETDWSFLLGFHQFGSLDQLDVSHFGSQIALQINL
jgi:predicted ABC-class ATPase